MQKCKKQNLLLLSVIFILLSVSRVVAFRDLSSEADEAAEEFSQEGMFGAFIYQYGQDLFRPEGNVTRENLILILKEYHVLTKKLLSQNKQLFYKINKLKLKSKPQKLSTQNMELILREFQKTLEPMLRNSQTILGLKQEIGEVSASAASPGSQRSKVRDKFESVDKKGILMLEGDIKKIKKEISALNMAVYAQKKYISNLTKETRDKSTSSSAIDRLKKEFENINKKVDNLGKLYRSKGKVVSGYDNGKKVAGIFKDDLDKIKNDMRDLKANISEQEKSIKEIFREQTFRSSGGDMIPFWVKISLGFTTIALFFMAR